MISKKDMLLTVDDLKSGIEILFVDEPENYNRIIEAIDLIALGWQVASDQLDSKVGVALGVDDGD